MLRGGGGGDGGEPVCGGLVRAIQQARERDLDGSGGASGATGAAAAGSQAGRYVGAVGSGSLSGGAGAGDRNHHGAGAAEYSVRFLALSGGGEIGVFRSAVGGGEGARSRQDPSVSGVSTVPRIAVGGGGGVAADRDGVALQPGEIV